MSLTLQLNSQQFQLMKANSHPSKNFKQDLQTQPSLMGELKMHMLSADSAISPTLIELLGKSAGLEQQLILLLRDAIAQNQKHPSLLNYLYIIDYLLTLPAYNSILHQFLPEYYCDLFKHLLSQQHRQGIETMKIFRKYWLAKIDYRLYRDLEEMVYRYYQIDIQWIQEKALPDLQKFYMEQLGMTINEVASHLPQLRHLQCQEPPRVIYSVNRTKDDEKKGKSRESKREMSKKKAKNTQKTNEQQKSQKKVPSSKDKQLLSEQQLQSLKRKRQQSEETTISLNLKGSKKMKQNVQTTLDSSTSDQVIIIDPKTPAIPKYSSRRKNKSDVRVEERGPLKGFNFLICHVCLQCGMKFILEKELIAHQEAHSNPQVDPQSESKDKDKNCVIVKEDEAHLYTRRCHVCDSEIDVDYQNGDWKFNHSVKITKYDITSIIHADCIKDVIPEVEDRLETDPKEEQ